MFLPPPLSNTAGATYTLSAYVKTENVSGNGAGVAVVTSKGTVHYSELVTGTTDTTADNGYRRVTLTVSLSSGETISEVRAGLWNASGTAYVNGISLVKGVYATDTNLIANSSIEDSTVFEDLVNGASYSTAYAHSGSRSIKIAPGAAGVGRMKVYLAYLDSASGSAGDVLSFGGWAKANGIYDKDFKIKIYFRNTSGSWVNPDGGEALFNRGVNTWQFTAATVKAPSDYTDILLDIYYSDQVNPAYFDDFFLIKSHQNTYTYDTETGNLTSSTDAAEQASSFKYEDVNNETLLTYLEDTLGMEYTYEYDDETGNLTSATSSSGQKIEITYGSSENINTNSNPIQTVTSDSNGNNKIVTSATYSADGERTMTNTDSRGNTETYTYEGDSGNGEYQRLSSITFDGITTSYDYDNVTDRLTSVQSGNSEVRYGYYTDGSLMCIVQGGYTYDFYYDAFGRTTRINVAERQLVRNYYDSLGRLYSVTYGNGNVASYIYDEKDQVKQIDTWGDIEQTTYYGYDAKGNAIKKTVENDKESYSYSYLYDTLGRLTSAYGRGEHSIAVQYDAKNRVTTVSNKVDGVGFKTTYSYNETMGTIQKVSSTKGSETFEKSYNLDTIGRITSYLYNTGNSTVEFTYLEGHKNISGSTTTLVKTMKVGGATYGYEYDKRGNITKVTKGGSEIQSYVYDELNQLTRENNAETNETVVYTYDNHGNILSKTVYPYNNTSAAGKTTTYGYDSDWTDLLVSYNGQSLTYDQIGNPLNYRDGFSFKWSGGRKLTSVKLDNGSVYMRGEYRYDDNGIRTYKEVNGNVTKYYLNGSTILTEVIDYGNATRRIDYIYDENGSVYGFSVGGEQYYYQKNLQGDVIGILDSSGNLLVEYVYTAFGVPTVSFPGITSSMTASQKKEIYVLGSNNPFRYRGYYFDTETGFYYLNSRYYDPVTGRFLNADAYVSTGQGVLSQNMFAYCLNNPVNLVDPSGEVAWVIAFAGLFLGIALLCTSSENQAPYYEQEAKEKYNQNNVSVYERNDPPEEKGTITAEIYYPSEETSNISINKSLDIKSGYEQEAILAVITESPYYSEDVYGSKSFMKAQWVAHNISYDLATSGTVGYWLTQRITRSSNPIESSQSLDLRSLNNITRGPRIVYTVISWFC